MSRTSCPSRAISSAQKWLLAQASMATVQAGCVARNLSTWFRRSFLPKSIAPDASASTLMARPAKLHHAAANVDREDNHAPGGVSLAEIICLTPKQRLDNLLKYSPDLNPNRTVLRQAQWERHDDRGGPSSDTA